MREIKFRRWTGKIMEDVGIVDIDDQRSMDYYNWWDHYSGETISFEKAPLMQFTGLKDKNGKEIYEGDICKRFHLAGKVLYHEERAMFILSDGFNEPLFMEGYALEVIGNIYENPELLK